MAFSSIIDTVTGMVPSCESKLPGFVDSACSHSPRVITDFFSSACQMGGDGASLLGKNICPILANAAPSLLYASAGALAIGAAASFLRARPHSLQASLDLWVNESPEGEGASRETARERILDFITDQNSDLLDLENLGLTSLPDIFENESFCSRLRTLYLSHNSLTVLPDTIGNLRALQHLDLDRNDLTALPDTIGNLRALQHLKLEHSILTILPETIGSLRALQHLDLENNALTALPETIGNLRALQHLKLEHNNLTALPETIGNLEVLELLRLRNNHLTALPGTIGNLRALQHLKLEYNALTALPGTIGNLRALQHLDLESNPHLNGLPTEILTIGGEEGRCRINLTRTGLSEAVRVRLQERTEAADYRGPQFYYSMEHHEPGVRSERSLENILGDLYRIVRKEPQVPTGLDEADEEQKEALRIWLSRMCDVADFRGPNQKVFVNKILSYVENANKDEAFRTTFFTVVDGAADTCGDRIALSTLHLGVANDLVKLDLNKIKELAAFFKRGVWVIQLLEGIAREKVSTLPFVDEIEVYLGYPVKLKERLNLSIAASDMLYFSCSRLTDADLDEAQALVEAQLENEKSFFEFLIQ